MNGMLCCVVLVWFGIRSYVDEGRVEGDVGAVVEDVDDGFADAGEAFDGLLDGSGAGGATHSDDGEKDGGF